MGATYDTFIERLKQRRVEQQAANEKKMNADDLADRVEAAIDRMVTGVVDQILRDTASPANIGGALGEFLGDLQTRTDIVGVNGQPIVVTYGYVERKISCRAISDWASDGCDLKIENEGVDPHGRAGRDRLYQTLREIIDVEPWDGEKVALTIRGAKRLTADLPATAEIPAEKAVEIAREAIWSHIERMRLAYDWAVDTDHDDVDYSDYKRATDGLDDEVELPLLAGPVLAVHCGETGLANDRRHVFLEVVDPAADPDAAMEKITAFLERHAELSPSVPTL